MEMNREAEQKMLHWMAKVHYCLEMWQGSQIPRATQKESLSHNKQMLAIWYFSDTDGIVNASWSLFRLDGAAALQLSEKSRVPPDVSAMDFPGEQTELLNVRW
jgi:hypothetical protein